MVLIASNFKISRSIFFPPKNDFSGIKLNKCLWEKPGRRTWLWSPTAWFRTAAPLLSPWPWMDTRVATAGGSARAAPPLTLEPSRWSRAPSPGLSTGLHPQCEKWNPIRVSFCHWTKEKTLESKTVELEESGRQKKTWKPRVNLDFSLHLHNNGSFKSAFGEA